jgi:hypothetical protein
MKEEFGADLDRLAGEVPCEMEREG